MVFHRRKFLWRYLVVSSVIVHALLFISLMTSSLTVLHRDYNSESSSLTNITRTSSYAVQSIQTTTNNEGSISTLRTYRRDGEKHNWGEVRNPHPFKYLINCEDMCRSVKGELFVLVYVHSALEHFKRRMVIRQTWGDMSNYDVNVRVIFVMGFRPESSANRTATQMQQALLFESEQYGDIVQEDFVDSYHNLTYKGVAALKWIAAYCDKAKYVLKTDDDIFVQFFSLISRIKRLEKKSQTTGVLMCLVWRNMKVMRTGKWRVNTSEYNSTHYPAYCSGSAFVMSTDLAVRLHEVSYYVPFFWVDDLYITGLLPLKLANVTYIQIFSNYMFNENKFAESFTGSQWYQVVFSHLHDLDKMQAVWRKVVQIHDGKLVPTVQYALPGHLPRTALELNKTSKLN